MKKNVILIIILIFSFSLKVKSQKEVNIWYFGEYAGIDFNSGSPVALTNSAMSQYEGCATISDANGNLLFYTNGMTVWNRNHEVMENGTYHGQQVADGTYFWVVDFEQVNKAGST